MKLTRLTALLSAAAMTITSLAIPYTAAGAEENNRTDETALLTEAGAVLSSDPTEAPTPIDIASLSDIEKAAPTPDANAVEFYQWTAKAVTVTKDLSKSSTVLFGNIPSGAKNVYVDFYTDETKLISIASSRVIADVANGIASATVKVTGKGSKKDTAYVYADLYYTLDDKQYFIEAPVPLSVKVSVISSGSSGGTSVIAEKIDDTKKFYYTTDGTNVRVSMAGVLDFNDFGDKNLVIACYDKGALINLRTIPLGEMVNGAELNPFTIKLDKVPEALEVKALAWSSLGEVKPICDAADLSDIPKNAHHAVGIVSGTFTAGANVDTDEVRFYDGDEDFRMNIGSSDIDEHLFESAEINYSEDINGDYTLLNYTLTGTSVTLSKQEIDPERTTASTVVTTDGRELALSENCTYYANGKEMHSGLYSGGSISEYLSKLSDKYCTVKLISSDGDNSSYEYCMVTDYVKGTISSTAADSSKNTMTVYFDEYDTEISNGKLVMDNNDADKLYRFINENNERCEASALKSYVGKEIYISYDRTGLFGDSDTYVFLLEGAQKYNEPEPAHEDRLSGAVSKTVLRYSESDGTAFLDGELDLDCDGAMPYDINVSIMSADEVLAQKTISSNTIVKTLVFSHEENPEADAKDSYILSGCNIPVSRRPDRAVISFDERFGIEDIVVPVADEKAFKVYGRIVGTFKSGANVDLGEVRFNVEKSYNWDGHPIDAWYDGAKNICVHNGTGRDIDSMMFVYSMATIEKDSNGEYTITSLIPVKSAEEWSKVLNTSDFKSISESYTESMLQMYSDASHSRYDTYILNTDTVAFINGREITNKVAYSIKDFFDGYYVRGNKSGKLTLIDASEEGRTRLDGKYDYIMVSYDVDGIVDEVEERSGKTYIYLSSSDPSISQGSIVIDEKNEDKSYNIILNGEKIKASDLQKGDVLSVEYDVTGRFADSDYYDIYVSRNTASGMVTSVYWDPDDALDNEYTFSDGCTYALAYDGVPVLEAGSSYTLYLDVHGRIAYAEENASTKNYALLENVYMTNGDADAYADIVTGTGEKVSYRINRDDFDSFADILMGENINLFDTSAKISNRVAPENRVISYKLTSKGELRLDAVEAGESFNGEYKSAAGKLGTRQLSKELTSIIDISDYDLNKSQSYYQVGTDELREGLAYKGYAYGKTASGAYMFILVTEGIGGFNVIDNWAVFVRSRIIADETGNTADAADVYVGGELKTIPVETESLIDDLFTGDIFFYKLNHDGEIEEIRIVASRLMANRSYRDLFSRAINNGFDMLDPQTSAQFASEEGSRIFAKPNNVDDCELIFGPIVSTSEDGIAIATPRELSRSNQSIDRFSIYDARDYVVAADANIYLYDYMYPKLIDRVSVSDASHMIKSSFALDSYIGNDRAGNIVDFTAEYDSELSLDNDNEGSVVFAAAKVVDGKIAEMLMIKPDGMSVTEVTEKPDEPLGEYFDMGILEDVYLAEGGAEAYAEIAAADGEKITRSIDPAAYDTFNNILMGGRTDVPEAERLANRAQPEDRVISYEDSGDGSITLNQVEEGSAFNGEYRSAAKKLDTRQLSGETQIIDISEYDGYISQSYPMIGLDDLCDGTAYKGYAFAKAGANMVYRFVIVTEGIGGFNVMNDWAVFVRSTTTATDNGEMPAAEMYVGGQLVTVPLEYEQLTKDMKAGDIFFYKLNRNREIEEIRMVTAPGTFTDYKSFYSNWLTRTKDGTSILDAATSAQFASEDGAVSREFQKPRNIDKCQLIAGPIVDATNGTVKLATVEEVARMGIESFGIDNTRSSAVFDLAGDARVYTYDFSISKAKDRITAAGANAVRKTRFDNRAYVGYKSDNVVDFEAQYSISDEEYNDNYGVVNFAIAKVVDDEISEIMVIIPDDNTYVYNSYEEE